jgi:hypothetical protein
MSQEIATTTAANIVDDASCATPTRSRRPPCPVCSTPMEPEHAHHKCPACGYIEPCCGW